MTEVDVLIVGGGPTGLLTAERLAKRWTVALIDRAVLGRTTKYWVTSERRLEMHGLAHCILHRAPGMIVGTFLGGSVRARGDLAVVDDRALLKNLLDRCREKNVELTELCALLSLSWSRDRIEAQTTSGPYRARLIVDATGGLSPIATTFRLQRLDGFYAVYGAFLKKVELRSADIILAYVGHLGDPPPVLEVIPCGNDSLYCAVFMYSRELAEPRSLEKIFRTYCRYNNFFSMTAQTEIGPMKMGAIPIGIMRRKQLPGVALVGEAALVQPPLLGTAFNEVLEYSTRVCTRLSEVLAECTGIPGAPNFRYPLLKRVQDRLQLEMTRMLLRGNVEALDRLTRFASSLPEPTVYDLCSNQLTWTSLLGVAARLPGHMVFSRHR